MADKQTTETPTPSAETPTNSAPIEVSADEFSGGQADTEGLEADFESFTIQEDNTPVVAPEPSKVSEQQQPPVAAEPPVVSAPLVVPPVPNAAAQPPNSTPEGSPRAPAESQSAAAAAPQVQPTPTEPAQVAPAPTQQQPAQPQAASGVDDTNPFADLFKQVGASRETLQKAIAETVYKLSDDEVAEVQDAPQTAIPKLMSKMHVNVVENVLGTIAQQLPAAVYGMLQANQRHKQNEDKFWDSWKQYGLDKNNQAHRQSFAQIAGLFRRANPNADLDTSIKMVGSQMVVALGLLQPQAAPTQPAARQVPPAPAAFVPAASGTGGPAPAAPQMNPWEEANAFILRDD